MRTATGLFLALPLLLIVGLWSWWALSSVAGWGQSQPTRPAVDPDRHACSEFYRKHPGEKPLNWRIGEVAQRFHEAQPMGKFVLDQNDCSDFVSCIVDEALGAGARFGRDPKRHFYVARREIWESRIWSGAEPVIIGDIIFVRHSPWYSPRETPYWHVGVVGADGMVYDFSKLVSWDRPRYGRHTIAWFVRNSPDAGEIAIERLAPRYRYLATALPAPPPTAPRKTAG